MPSGLLGTDSAASCANDLPPRRYWTRLRLGAGSQRQSQDPREAAAAPRRQAAGPQRRGPALLPAQGSSDRHLAPHPAITCRSDRSRRGCDQVSRAPGRGGGSWGALPPPAAGPTQRAGRALQTAPCGPYAGPGEGAGLLPASGSRSCVSSTASPDLEASGLCFLGVRFKRRFLCPLTNAHVAGRGYDRHPHRPPKAAGGPHCRRPPEPDVAPAASPLGPASFPAARGHPAVSCPGGDSQGPESRPHNGWRPSAKRLPHAHCRRQVPAGPGAGRAAPPGQRQRRGQQVPTCCLGPGFPAGFLRALPLLGGSQGRRR